MEKMTQRCSRCNRRDGTQFLDKETKYPEHARDDFPFHPEYLPVPNRPAIPADLQRDILIECGHRCAVCGVGCPLEFAHIIPWRNSKQHKFEDLICLCANCHERADKEQWGEKTLREYKKRPWVHRQSQTVVDAKEPISTLRVTLDMNLSAFDDKTKAYLEAKLSAFINLLPSDVKVESPREGSVKVSITLPKVYAGKLIDAFDQRDPLLPKYLFPFVVMDVSQQTSNNDINSITALPPRSDVIVNRVSDHELRELAKRAIAEDRAAAVAFYGYVTDFSRSILTQHHVAQSELDDVNQEVLLGVRESLNELELVRNLHAFIGTIATRRARDWHRTVLRDKRRTAKLVSDYVLTVDTHARECQKNLAQHYEETEFVAKFIDTLDPDDRAIIEGRQEGLSIAKIAKDLGITDAEIKKRIGRIKEKVTSFSSH